AASVPLRQLDNVGAVIPLRAHQRGARLPNNRIEPYVAVLEVGAVPPILLRNTGQAFHVEDQYPVAYPLGDFYPAFPQIVCEAHAVKPPASMSPCEALPLWCCCTCSRNDLPDTLGSPFWVHSSCRSTSGYERGACRKSSIHRSKESLSLSDRDRYQLHVAHPLGLYAAIASLS